MARWLIFYTPIATIVRLFSINAINAYLTSWALALIGLNDSQMLLPAWIFIACVQTICYHATLRKMRVPRESSPAIYLLCIASFLSMLGLWGEIRVCALIDVE